MESALGVFLLCRISQIIGLHPVSSSVNVLALG